MVALLSSTIDTSQVSEVINLIKSAMGLFAEFPLNVFIIASLVALGFAILQKAKSAAGGK